MTDGPGRASRGRHANVNPMTAPITAHEPGMPYPGPDQARGAPVNRRIAIVIAILGLIGVLVPLSRAAVDALAVARADLGTFTIDDVADFMTSSGGHDGDTP